MFTQKTQLQFAILFTILLGSYSCGTNNNPPQQLNPRVPLNPPLRVNYRQIPAYCVQQAQEDERRRRFGGNPNTTIISTHTAISCINNIASTNFSNYKVISSLPPEQRQTMCRLMENDNRPLIELGANTGMGYSLAMQLCATSR